jgi:uncharacterized membrane protein
MTTERGAASTNGADSWTGASPFGSTIAGRQPESGNGHTQPNAPLGWLSLGVGVGTLLFPRKTAELMGVRPTSAVARAMRAVGIREVATGLGVLCQPRWSGWPWVRVAGDAMDLALLQTALVKNVVRHDRRFAATTAAVAGITATDIAVARPFGPRRIKQPDLVQVTAAVTVKRSVADVYRVWRDFESFPRFMANVESVRVLDERRSRWRAVGPAGSTVEWDAEIVDESPNEHIAWQAVPSSQVLNVGRVSFRPAPEHKGTEVRVEMSYEPPAGSAGWLVARLFGREPGQEVRGDLRRLKSLLETGEVVVSDATLEGRSIKQRSAQPPDDVREYVARAS